jgi:hypothetical protein
MGRSRRRCPGRGAAGIVCGFIGLQYRLAHKSLLDYKVNRAERCANLRKR